MSILDALQDTYIVSTYMKQKLPSVLRRALGNMEGPDLLDVEYVDLPHPSGWSMDFALEVDRALLVIGRAFHNQASTQWDVRRYADHIGLKYSGMNEDLEETLRKTFKPLKVNHLQITPCTITDRHGQILLWYLPNILRPERQKSMFADLNMLEPVLKIDNRSKNWRSSPDYYREVINGLKPGSLNISPAWFEQGHESEKHLLKVSEVLKRENPTCEWLRTNRLPFALIGGILSIIHPMLYDMGVQALKELQSDRKLCDNPERLQEVLAFWHAPFSAISVISNWLTPLHCDTGGRAEWTDLLLALGEYDNGRFSVPAFGYTFKYNPGAIIGFSSKIFRHGATCVGNRAAIAFYMRDNVLNRLGRPSGTWMEQAEYQNLLAPITNRII